MIRKAISILLLLGWSSAGSAGIYTDELSKCLVESSTKADRAALVRWMFTAASSHPAVSDISAATPEAKEKSSKAVADLFTRLVTKSCVEKTKKAMAYEGNSAIQTSFGVLGQVAGAELFGSPEVAGALSDLQKYVDTSKFEALGKP